METSTPKVSEKTDRQPSAARTAFIPKWFNDDASHLVHVYYSDHVAAHLLFAYPNREYVASYCSGSNAAR
eukprot:1839753-Amphidinium_carterae.1